MRRMNLTDLKVYLLNGSAITFLSFTEKVGPILQVLLTTIVAGYTLHKWYLMAKQERKNKKNANKK